MGSITSLVDGSTHHYSELVTVTYDSGTFDFGNGAGQIATLVFEQNGIPKATRSTQPTAAPATYSQSWALPASGATAIIRVHAKNLMGMVLETVEVTLNLDAQPAATCAGATDQAMDALTLNGNIVGIPAGGSAQFRYGTVNGGPYPDTIPAFPQAVGPTSAALTGLTAGTVYYYVLEILDASSTVVATSPQCSGQTLLDANQAGPACPVPPFVDECPPKQVYSVGGVEYISYQFCDKATNTPILVVYRLCDGEPSDLPTYYDLLGQPFTPTGAVGLCDTGLDYETLCDKGTDPNTRILALWDTSTVPPTLKYYTPGIDGSLVAYTPIGPVSDCPETDVEESQICYLAINAGAGYAAGDQLLQILFWDTGEQPPTLTATIWRNQTQNTILAAAPNLAHLSSCEASDHEFQVLCDDNGPFLRRYTVNASGVVSFTDTELDGVTAYVATGLVGVCPEVSESPTSECFVADTDGDGYAAGDRLIQVLFWDVSTTPNAVSEMAWYNVSAGTTLTTEPLAEDLRPCGLAVTPESFCYTAITTEAEWTTGDTLRYIRFYDSSNRNDIALSGELWWNVTAGTPISALPVIGTDVLECPTECNQHEFVILCDDDGAGTITKFLRHLTITCGGTVYTADTEFDGNTPYDVVGTVTTCGSTGKDLIKACDKVTTAGGPVAGTCGVNQQKIDAVDIQDAEEKNPTTGGSAVNVNDNDLELAGQSEVGETDWQIAVRFNMNIPQGATICNAYIQFTSEGTVSTGALTATIRGENVDASAPFTTAAGMLTARVKTAASVAWTVPQWPSSNQAGADQRTPDLTTIVQEIVNRAGWTANNAAAFFLIPGTTGYRRASSILDGTEAPKLHVEYVVDQATSETTVCIPFWKEVDLSSGTATGNNYRINETTGDWEAYTPTGTVTDGECVCPGDIATDFETLCLQDSTNTRFIRIITIDDTGAYTVVGNYDLAFTSEYTPVGAVVPCQSDGGGEDIELIVLCDDNGSFIRHIVHGAQSGTVSQVFDTALDGATDYTPVGTVKICQPSDSSDIEIVTLCDDNGPFLRFITRNVDGSITANDTQLDGVTAYLPVGTVKSCSAPGKSLIQACDKTTTATGATPGICGTNQQTADAVDIQDAEEKNPTTGASAVNVNDNDLEMAGQAEAKETDYQIGVRFALNVPKGAKICSAYIQFTSRSTTSFGTLIATIRGEAADTSAPFTTTAGMLTARAKTTANVSWNVPLWPTSGQAGAAQRTPDLSTIVQEIVDRAGWVAGNNTAFIFTPGATGYRRAQSLPRGTAVAPKLHVEYVLDTPGGSTDVCVPFYKEIDLSTGLATGNNYRLNAGTWSAYTPTGTVTDGNCLSCTVQRSSTIQRQVGAGTVTVASGARSLSIVVLSGQPTVSIGAGAAVALATGISLNWGASSDKEVLTDAFSFTCAAGDDLIVTTIR